MKPLTKIKKKIDRFIENYHGKYGIAPSLADISKHMDSPTSTTPGHLTAIVKKGYIAHRPGVPRSYRVLPLKYCKEAQGYCFRGKHK